MWKNSLKNVESDNNKILYETLLDFFYSETVLTVWISLVEVDSDSKLNKCLKVTGFINSMYIAQKPLKKPREKTTQYTGKSSFVML